MSESANWSAATALRRCPRHPWSGRVWRGHGRRYTGSDHGGSLRVSGRYNCGTDLFPLHETWPALYTALGAHTALLEILRHVEPATALDDLAARRFTELAVSLQFVIDCRDLALLGVERADLCHDTDWDLPRAMAREARQQGAEAILVPSATAWGDNLIIFPDRCQAGSTLVEIGSIEPRVLRDQLIQS